MPRRVSAKRITAAVKRTAAKVTTRARAPKVKAKAPTSRTAPRTTRKKRVATDISESALDATYAPKQTSLKAPFRADGADHQRDQEFARGVDDRHWNDEDRLTNKSGDPRIGTHGRTYEPGEPPARSQSRRRKTMDTSLGTAGINTSKASDTGATTCAHCGQSYNSDPDTHAGLDQFLGKIGISDDMISNLKTQFQNVDVEEYLNTARQYLKGGGGKAKDFAKSNPGAVAAGVAVLAVGAGLLINALHKD